MSEHAQSGDGIIINLINEKFKDINLNYEQIKDMVGEKQNITKKGYTYRLKEIFSKLGRLLTSGATLLAAVLIIVLNAHAKTTDIIKDKKVTDELFEELNKEQDDTSIKFKGVFDLFLSDKKRFYPVKFMLDGSSTYYYGHIKKLIMEETPFIYEKHHAHSSKTGISESLYDGENNIINMYNYCVFNNYIKKNADDIIWSYSDKEIDGYTLAITLKVQEAKDVINLINNSQDSHKIKIYSEVKGGIEKTLKGTYIYNATINEKNIDCLIPYDLENDACIVDVDNNLLFGESNVNIDTIRKSSNNSECESFLLYASSYVKCYKEIVDPQTRKISYFYTFDYDVTKLLSTWQK